MGEGLLDKAHWRGLGPSTKVPRQCKVVNASRKAASAQITAQISEKIAQILEEPPLSFPISAIRAGPMISEAVQVPVSRF